LLKPVWFRPPGKQSARVHAHGRHARRKSDESFLKHNSIALKKTFKILKFYHCSTKILRAIADKREIFTRSTMLSGG
jgi:hypothetical protein